MYLPPQFDQSQNDAVAARIMREHPLASLISVGATGEPLVSHIPLHLANASAPFRLLGHVAKANAHGKLLAVEPKALVTFMGPQAYMSPKVYPDLARVPTWSYLAVHAQVTVRLLEGLEAKDAMLKMLIADHESAYAQQWRDLGEAYQHKMLAGITAFELNVTALQCAVKLNQHRPEVHTAMHAAYAVGNAQERALATWMVDLGLVAKEALENPL